MQEDRPLFPRKVEGPFEFLDVLHDTEAALCIRVRKRVNANSGRLYDLRRYACGQIEQRLGCLAGQVVCGVAEERATR